MNQWVEHARAMREDIAAAQSTMDAERRCPNDLARKLADAGFFRLCVPKAYGGAQASPREIAEALEALAETDASAAWCAMIGATTGALAAYLEPVTAREIFGAVDAIVTGVYAPMGKAVAEGDAYRVSGQWKWNSAGQNSSWLAGGCVILADGKPKLSADGTPVLRMALAPRDQVTFIDTWHTGGLRGTGSGDMAMKDVLVPQARSISLVDDKPRLEAPLYAFPVFGLLAMGIAAVASGNAKAALAEFAAVAASKRMPNGRTLAERGATQAMFAQASAEYAAARALFLQEIDAAWREAEAGAEISVAQRARLRLAATHMTRTAADVVRRVQDFAGGGSVFLSDPLQRRLRDAQTATAHIMIAPATYELTGRVLLGGQASTLEL
jgi:alkylation response protein AidB-like acyl-CoA dehydrogenase